MIKILFLTASMLFVVTGVSAQLETLDSIHQKIDRAPNDTTKIKLLILLGGWRFDLTDYSGSTANLKKAYELSVKNNFPLGLAYRDYYKGVEQVESNHFDKAILLFKSCISSLDSLHSIQGLLSPLCILRLIYNLNGDQAARLEYYTEKLAYYEKHGPKENTAACLHALAGYHVQLNDFDQATRYYLRAREAFSSFDPIGAANEMMALGKYYSEWGNFEKGKIYIDKALVEHVKIGFTEDIISCNNFLGDYYLKQNDFPGAMGYYNGNRKYWKEMSDTPVAICLIRFAAAYLQSNQLDSAWKYLAIVDRMVKEGKVNIQTNHGFIESDYYSYQYYKRLNENAIALQYLESALSRAKFYRNVPFEVKYTREFSSWYLTQRDSTEAYRFLQQYVTLRDSADKVEKRMRVLSFERDLTEQQQQKQLEQFQAKKAIEARNYLIAGVTLLLIIIGTLSRLQYTRKTRKVLEKKNRQIEAEKETSDLMRARAEKSEKFKQQFLSNMSHEIRTPMNAVMGMTTLLMDKNPRSDQRQYLNGIKNASENLLHIINDILDLAKIEAGKIDLERIDFSMLEVIEQVKQTLHQKAEEKGIQLVTSIDTRVPDVVVGDPGRLNQVLMNLAGNAIKFTEKGSVLIDVTPGISGIQFSIIDTGIGIPEDKIKSVFESFTQAHSSDTRNHGGTGLGLTISKQLVEQMGGTLSIESKEGSGSTFSFEIDYPVGSAERIHSQKSVEQVDGSILNGLKILLADDNEHNRIVARDTLQLKAHLEITEAVNGAEVIEILTHHDFDVILMDVQMPIMDGYEATRHIRELFSFPKNKIPVIALTASVIRSDLDHCRQAGMTDYVAKPYKSAQLITAIAKATGREIKFLDEKKVEVKNKTYVSSTLTDLRYLNEFCEGDSARMKKYINLFLESVPVFIEKLKRTAEENNVEEIASQIHGFKTKWIMMGMKDAKDLALEIEQQCRQETVDLAQVKDKVAVLMDQVQSATRELQT